MNIFLSSRGRGFIALYALLGAAWVAASDVFLVGARAPGLSTLKGVAFVVLSALGFGLLLQRTLDKGRRLSAASVVGVFLAAPDGTIRDVNGRWTALTGRSKGRAREGDWLRLVHADDRARVLREWEERLRSPGEMQLQFRLDQSDAVPCVVRAVLTPEHDRRGRLVGWLGSITDITDLQESLSRERVRVDGLVSLARRAPELTEGQLLEQALLVVREVTGSRCAWFGLLRGEGGPDTLAASGMDPASSADCLGCFAAATRAGQVVLSDRHPSACPSAHGHPMLCVPLSRPAGASGVLCVSRESRPYDADDVRQVQLVGESVWRLVEAQRERRAKRDIDQAFRHLFESSPLPQLVVAVDTLQLLAANDAALHSYGWKPEDVPKRSLADLHAEVDRPRLLGMLRSAEGYLPTGVWPHVTRDGSVRQIRLTLHGITWNEAPARLVLLEDVTEAFAAGRALRLSEERLRIALAAGNLGLFEHDLESDGLRVTADDARLVGDADRESAWALDALLSRVHPDDLTRITAAIDACRRNERSDFRIEYRVRISEGWKWFLSVGAVVERAPDGTPLRIAGAATDVDEQHRVREALESSRDQLRNAMYGTLEAVGAMLELRDPYTSGHQRRVGDLAAAIGHELGLDAFRCEGLRLAGCVHDVGKIAVPSELLTRPGKLERAEFELIKAHAQRGYEVLSPLAFPWPVAEIARQHHERLDGSGYPRGLEGDEILLEARIIAVADTVEAMTAHRPYRPGKGIDSALAAIRELRGIHYDPDAVDACLRLFEEKRFAFSQQHAA